MSVCTMIREWCSCVKAVGCWAVAFKNRYELETCIYMLEPWEKVLTHILLLISFYFTFVWTWGLLGILFNSLQLGCTVWDSDFPALDLQVLLWQT